MSAASCDMEIVVELSAGSYGPEILVLKGFQIIVSLLGERYKIATSNSNLIYGIMNSCIA